MCKAVLSGAFVLCLTLGATGQNLSSQAWDLESKGDAAGARELLQRAAQSAPNDHAAVEAYAQFLDRHHDPAARAEWERVLTVAHDKDARAAAAKRLVLLDLLAGDRQTAAH